MRTRNVAGFPACLLAFISLSILWMSCNQSSTGEGAEKAATTDTSITEIFEMKRPGSLIPKDSAAKMIKAYRRAGGGPFATQIVLHHPDAVKFYMDSIFNKYTPGVTLPQGHVWRVAFSPMYYRQPGGPKLSFCLVPCIVDTGNARVYEFFNQMDSATEYYTKYYLPLYNSIAPFTIKGTLKGMRTDTTGFVFNEGQLWP